MRTGRVGSSFNGSVNLRPRHRRGDEHGAAAVEFALVCSVLFTIVFGIIQYGLFFNDSLSTRQGVRDGARMGVVRNFATASPCTTQADDMAKLRCSTRLLIGTPQAKTFVKVVRPATWAKTQPLVVCAVVESYGKNGLLPMPDGGYTSSVTQMSIEQDATPLPTGTTTADPLPTGVTYPC